jgi:hypothetical protein
MSGYCFWKSSVNLKATTGKPLPETKPKERRVKRKSAHPSISKGGDGSRRKTSVPLVEVLVIFIDVVVGPLRVGDGTGLGIPQSMDIGNDGKVAGELDRKQEDGDRISAKFDRRESIEQGKTYLESSGQSSRIPEVVERDLSVSVEAAEEQNARDDQL